MDNSSTMLELCRLCLVKDDVNTPIFEEQGDIKQIFLKISSCLPVKVSREDQLPKKICDGCSYKLDLLYEFWNTSANAEKQLLCWLGEAGMNSKMTDGTMSAVAQQIKPTETLVKQEEVDPPDIHTEDDEEDDKSYMFQQKLEESASAGPSATVTSNEEEEPPPKRVRRTAAVKAAIAMDRDSDEDDDDSGEPMTKVEDESEDSEGDDHEPAFVDVPSTSADDQPGPSGVGKDGVDAPQIVTKSRSKKIHRIKQSESVSEEMVSQKTVCSNKDPDFMITKRKPGRKPRKPPEPEYNLEKFVNLNEVTQPLTCKLCPKTFTTHIDLGLHSIIHNKEGLFSCHMCDFMKDTKKTFKNHIKSHNLYQCEKCLRIFKNKLSAYKHSQWHYSESTVTCDVCGKRLKKQSLTAHIKMLHSGIKPSRATSCPVCGKEYLNPSSLKQHYSTVHKELGVDVSVVCDICGMRLSCKSKLAPHVRIHTGDKPFSCLLCPKQFVTKDRLANHIRIHTGEKPYGCKYCGKRFGQDGPYRYHVKTHTGEKSHSCPICGKKFIAKANMRIHLKTCVLPVR